MRNRQYKVLIESIHKRKGDQVEIVFSEQRIHFEEAQGIIHPPHIPFIVEPKPTCLDWFRDVGPSSTLFRDHVCVRLAFEYFCVHLLEEFDSLAIVIAAILIRCPWTFIIVKIKHIRNGIDTDSIKMELLQPENGVRNQEAVHLCFSQVKIQCPPTVVDGAIRIGIFKSRCTIKIGQRIIIFAEMAGNPIHDDADSFFMRFFHKIPQLKQIPVTRSHREVPGDLIAPRSFQRMFHQRHEFDVRVAHFLHIWNQRFSKIFKGIPAAIIMLFP